MKARELNLCSLRANAPTKRRLALGLALAPYLLLAYQVKPAATPPGVDKFTPAFIVVRAHCMTCHSGKDAAADLDLSSTAGIAKGGMSGKLFVPGNADASLLVRRLKGLDGKPQMPRGFRPLSKDDMALIEAWIDSGGKITEPKKHWAYIPPVTPKLPSVREKRWPRNPIDFFVLAGLEKTGLHPSPEASKETLARRVSLDLIGLPPSPGEVDAFVNDKSPNAYEKMVDRLLASPHFGERMARPWLDLARYADSNGYEKDLSRSIWAYRDWVISAFNANMPYDEFTKKQIAGDMLPNATLDDKIATGFNRNVMLNEEGGVDEGEQRWLRLCDMVATTSQTWLGETIQCATCHNHKYDPILQKDFYSFLAFFETADTPNQELRPALNKTRSELRAQIADLQKAIDALPKNSPDLVGKKVELQELNDRLGLLSRPTTPVFQEKPGAQPATFIRIKGTYLAPGDKVNANVPAALGQFKPWMPRNRLGLAEWLASKANPLTARVEVNRLWEICFGRGIVETSENFGTQGTPPSNQELLDWLATEFMRKDWNIKAMMKTTVMSATYRQSSDASKNSLRLDPQNVLLSRGPRFRMEAEMIRDNALTAAGLLNLKIGGPSVHPYQPEGIWNSPYSGERWTNDTGPDSHRRGIYTFWKRTAPYPSFITLDATSREKLAPSEESGPIRLCRLWT